MMMQQTAREEGEAFTEQVLRERDFAKYLEPMLSENPPLAFVAPRDQPVPSEDTSLSAFALLAAIKLKAKRAFISLISNETQYILAEATQSLSLSGECLDNVTAEDRLVMGCCAFPASQGACQHAVALPLPKEPRRPSVFICPDMACDERLKGVHAMHESFRFYAGTPIRSPAGHSIGAFCIVDDKPRTGLDPSQMVFMQDMAVTTFKHLASSRFKQDHRRSDRMVRSIGSLVEGKSSIQEWSWNTPASTLLPAKRSLVVEPDQDAVASPEPIAEPPNGPHRDKADGASPASTVVHEESPSKPLPSRQSKQSVSEMASTLSNLFGRASNLIREALELEGVLFLGASARDLSALPPPGRLQRPSRQESKDSSSSDSEASGPGSLKHRNAQDSADEKSYCRVLGFSAGSTASINGDDPASTHALFREQFMAEMLRRYPYGKVFHSDEMASMSQADLIKGVSQIPHASKERTEGRVRKERRRRILRERLGHFRSLVFLPLRDMQKNRWYGGAFAWTNSDTRLFTEEGELSYLAAFDNTIMAEVALLDALSADRAKADFISSISHELRSPLHGILGSTEFLREAVSNAFQSDMINNIETCGRTLLDTIDHLLDFTKINRISTSAQAVKRRRLTGSAADTPNGGYSTKHDDGANVADITEEVIHTMVSSQNSRRPSYDQSLETGDFQASKTSTKPPVRVIVNIAPAASRLFKVQCGAWRRVVMNLVGNSLKYTERGYISVSLEAQDKADSEYCQITLKVTDTGRGMSKAYVQSNLFTPFVQEDSFSVGTGLGLSIVNQIVDSHGGCINVESRKDVGTQIQVSLPLRRLADGQTPCTSPTMRAAQSKARGLRLQISCPYPEHAPTGLEAQMAGAVESGGLLWRESIEKLCREWFDMKVTVQNGKRPDILVTDWFAGQDCSIARKTIEGSTSHDNPASIVSCSNVRTVFGIFKYDDTLDLTNTSARVQLINQPTGPNNFAAALLRLLGDPNEGITTSALSSEGLFSTAPLAFDDAQSPGRKADSETAPTVLLVDDNHINLALLRRFMDQLGLPYVTAENGQLALEAYKRSNGRISFIFMDISMPVMDGMTASREIRAWEKRHALRHARIVALTGLASEASQDEAAAVGIDRFLTKPVKFSVMRSLMGR